jgi:hypothetical protein
MYCERAWKDQIGGAAPGGTALASETFTVNLAVHPAHVLRLALTKEKDPMPVNIQLIHKYMNLRRDSVSRPWHHSARGPFYCVVHVLSSSPPQVPLLYNRRVSRLSFCCSYIVLLRLRQRRHQSVRLQAQRSHEPDMSAGVPAWMRAAVCIASRPALCTVTRL